MDLEALCKEVIEISREVGAFIRKEALAFDVSKIERKGINDLVSYVDREAEKRLINKLDPLVPQVGYVSEEDTDHHRLSDNDYHWIIDPLDGTTNFMHNLPVYSISIALMHKTELLVGVIYEINRDECFYAWKDGGAYCNDRQIYVSPTDYLKDSLLATGFPFRDFDQVPTYLDIINRLMRCTHGLRRMGSAAVDLAYVAMGRFEGFFEYNLHPWDVAAGALLVKEAGGMVSTFKGEGDYIFGKQIVAAGPIHPLMLEIIQKHWVFEK